MKKKLTKGKHWEIVRPDDPAPADAAQPERQSIRVRLEKRRKGKVVTTVTGLPLTRDETKALAKALKTLCGTGGTAGDGELELQGDHRDAVAAYIRSQGNSTSTR